MPTQQHAPSAMGFPPVLMSFTISVFMPIALIASTMKNLLSSFTGANTEASTPRLTATVVMMDAPMK